MATTKPEPKPTTSAQAASSGGHATKKPAVKTNGSVANPLVLKGSRVKKSKPAPSGRAKGPAVRLPLTDEQLGPIPDLPTETEIEQQVGKLSTTDKARFTKIRQLLAEHLGSYAAARAWLTAPVSGFEGTPLQAIRDGMAKRVLELIQAQSSRNPPYA
jgi:Protein of unknown function (DUF2384)